MLRALARGGVALGLGFVFVSGLSGCASTEPNSAVHRREKAVDAIDQTRHDLRRADLSVTATQQALQRLASQQAGDLEVTYANFVTQVEHNQAVSKSLNSRAIALAQETGRHVNEWSFQARTIRDQQLQQRSLERQQQARREQDEIAQSLSDLRGRYVVYIRQLQDISTYAANDLTPAGIAAIRDHVESATKMAGDLRTEMAQIDQRLDRLAASWQSQVPLAAGTPQDPAVPAAATIPPTQTERDYSIPALPEVPANQPAEADDDVMNW